MTWNPDLVLEAAREVRVLAQAYEDAVNAYMAANAQANEAAHQKTEAWDKLQAARARLNVIVEGDG